jgi:hypothetical protein
MLMVGVTLAMGSAVVVAAVGQFSTQANSASVGANLQRSSVEIRVSLVYALVAPSAGCPLDDGAQEGTTLMLSLYNYGSAPFAPAGVGVNSTFYQSTFPVLDAGTMGTYSIPLGACAHPVGQTILLFDSQGDEVQIET